MGSGGIFLRKLRARVSEQPTGFVWVEKGSLAASGYPASRGQVGWLVNQGLDAVLSLSENPLPIEFVQGLPLKVGHVPMKDHEAPPLESLDRAASFIQAEIREGRTALVHCVAGEGRTGCALAAYLIKERGIDASEALKILRKVKPSFVESSQEGALSAYQAIARSTST